jgi:hypothetical protein
MDEKPSKPPTFFVALEQLMESYHVADYAVVARTVDAETRSTWIAGVGQNIVSDRERAMVLYGEMALLQNSILNRYTLKPNGSQEGH